MPILPLLSGRMYLSISSRRRAQHERLHRADVHDVTHRGGRAAVARERLADHREGHVVLAQAAVLLGHREREEAVLAQQLEVAARVEQLVVGALRVGAHLLLAELDQRRRAAPSGARSGPSRGPSRSRAPRRARRPTSSPASQHPSVVDRSYKLVHELTARLAPVRPQPSRGHRRGSIDPSVADGTKRARLDQFVHRRVGGRPRRRRHGYSAGRGAAASQGDDVVGRLRGRAREPGLPHRGARRLDRRARHHRRVRALDDLDHASARCRTTSTPSWRRCSRTSPAASRSTRTRRGAST